MNILIILYSNHEIILYAAATFHFHKIVRYFCGNFTRPHLYEYMCICAYVFVCSVFKCSTHFVFCCFFNYLLVALWIPMSNFNLLVTYEIMLLFCVDSIYKYNSYNIFCRSNRKCVQYERVKSWKYIIFFLNVCL